MASAIGAVIGAELRGHLVKNVTPIFDKVGKLAQEVVGKLTTMVSDALNHHHHVSVKECSGVDLVIDELAVDVIGHQIRLTVLWSPDDKMNDKSFQSSGTSASVARASAMSCIEAVAKYTYGKK